MKLALITLFSLFHCAFAAAQSNATFSQLKTKTIQTLPLTSQPVACTGSARGTFWFKQGAAGTGDGVEVCVLQANGTYAWVALSQATANPVTAPTPVPVTYQGSDPPTNLTFSQAVAPLSQVQDYEFGTGSGRNIGNITQLAGAFNPYGIAGTYTINNEWELYQPFSSAANFVFTPTSLNLTATLAGALQAGGINSGQITTQQTFAPGVTGAIVYAFEVSMKVPNGHGAWPAVWLYAKNPAGGSAQPQGSDGSEIDNPEIYQYQSGQDTHTWTEHEHGPHIGTGIYSIETATDPASVQGTTNSSAGGQFNNNVDYSQGLHSFQTLWTPDAVYKYIDGVLIEGRHFTWSSGSPAQLIVNLAVGSTYDGTLQPDSSAEFPMALSVDHIKIWSK